MPTASPILLSRFNFPIFISRKAQIVWFLITHLSQHVCSYICHTIQPVRPQFIPHWCHCSQHSDQAGRPGVSFPEETAEFSQLQNVQTGSEAHQATCSMGTKGKRGHFSGVKRLGVELLTLFYLVPTVKLSRAESLSPYVFLTCTRKPLPLPLPLWFQKHSHVHAQAVGLTYKYLSEVSLWGSGYFKAVLLLLLLLLSIGPRWLMPRMYCSHIGLLYYP